MVKPPVSILILCLINSFLSTFGKFNKQMNGKTKFAVIGGGLATAITKCYA
jgi:hypothetical protein